MSILMKILRKLVHAYSIYKIKYYAFKYTHQQMIILSTGI